MLCYVIHTDKQSLFYKTGLYLVLWCQIGKQTESMKACWSAHIFSSWFKDWFELMWIVPHAVTTAFLSCPSSQELSDFDEGLNTIWTVSKEEFDQVRWISSRGATDLPTLCFNVCLFHLFSHQSTEDSEDEMPQIVKKKNTLEHVPYKHPWDFCVVESVCLNILTITFCFLSWGMIYLCTAMYSQHNILERIQSLVNQLIHVCIWN